MLSAAAAHADTRSTELLGGMAAKIGGWKQYRVEFMLRADPGAKAVAGNYVVSGRRYRLSVEDREVYGDGTTKYEVNKTDREVLVDRVDPGDKSILSNPTDVFRFSDDVFTHNYSGAVTYAGRKCEKVTLRPKDAGSAVTGIDLWLDARTMLPVAVSYRMEGVSTPVSIDVTAIVPLQSVAEGELRFDRSKYRGFEVIDFR